MKHSAWEDAVRGLRGRSEYCDLVQFCYFDDSILGAAQRFAKSDEWGTTQELIEDKGDCALDVGAGRGIASYALARDGWQVSALEPDSGELVGTAAIRSLAHEADLSINVVEGAAEELPFDDNTFDLVYAREVLHHTADLSRVCEQVFRVLKPNGMFIAVREHVISKRSDLDPFLASHPLHKLYGGEKALLLDEYLAAFAEAGFSDTRTIGPFDSVINFFPLTRNEWRQRCAASLMPILGYRLSLHAVSEKHCVGRWFLKRLSGTLSRTDDTPGRLYSFVMRKGAAR